MRSKNRLIVIGEPEIVPSVGTRNNAMNEILQHYTNHNVEVTYMAGTEFSKSMDSYSVESVNYIPLCFHSKSKRFVIKHRKLIVDKFLSCYQPGVHVQFRLPSIFVLQVYYILMFHIRKDDLSFYIAGDWKKSLEFNYPDKKYLSFILPLLQEKVLKNKVCVCTGDVLARDVSVSAKRCMAFYSTTHTDEDVIFKKKSNVRNICFIGRIEKLKNFQFVLNLTENEYIKKEYNLHILGDGPDIEELKKGIDGKGNITYHGHVSSRKEVTRVLDSCKYLILPSYTEGTSKTLPEAMSRSVVPIAFKGVGANDFILSDKRGKLAPVDDLESVVNFIKCLDFNVDEYERNLGECVEYAKEKTIENQLNKMFGFLYA